MRSRTFILSALTASLALTPNLARAQTQSAQQEAQQSDNPNTWSRSETLRIVQEVRHQLLSLPYYSVFDALTFGIKGKTIILEGYASRPVLKSDAENVVKKISGVESVDNQIKVLPLSPMDDNIRARVYRAIYSQPSLRKYTSSPVGFGRFPSVARMAGGITQDPPIGYNAIHIIVDNGNVTLLGAVDSEGDATIAGMQANLVSGVFSVHNDLVVAGKPAKQKGSK